MNKSNFGEVGFSQSNQLENDILAFERLLNLGIQVYGPNTRPTDSSISCPHAVSLLFSVKLFPAH
jgi:hypothetical protein